MNILHFGSNYLPNNGGNVVRMCHMLENNRYTINDKIYVMTTAPKKDFDDEKYYLRTKIKIIRVNSLKEAEGYLLEVVDKYQIDVVVTHVIPANIIACRSLSQNVRIVSEIHSLIQSSRLKMLGKELLHRFWLNRRTSLYFVLSNSAASYIIKHYGVHPSKVVFLPNGISLGEQTIQGGNDKYFTFGYVGTFYSWQGINLIYENIDRILSIDKKVRLYLVGGGEKENELMELAQKEDYKGRLIVTGMIPKKEIAQCMKEIDVMLIPRPSTLETETAIPLKIFESVEYGKPAIISKVKGLTEVLGEQEAFVFDPKSSDELVTVCREAMEHPELCCRKFQYAIKKLQEWPSWDEIHEIQYKAISDVVDRG